MSWEEILRWGLTLIAWAQQIAEQQGLSPDEFDRQVTEARDARAREVAAQRAAALKEMAP